MGAMTQGQQGRKAKRQPESQKLLVSGWPQSSAEKAEFIIPAASPSCYEEDEDLTNPNSYYNARGRMLSKSRLRFRSGLTKTNAAFDIDFTKHSRKPGTATDDYAKNSVEQISPGGKEAPSASCCHQVRPMILWLLWVSEKTIPSGTPPPSVLLWGSLSSNGVS